MRQDVQNGNYSESVAVVPPLYEDYNADLNSNNKSWAVPTNEMWKLNFARVIYTSDATVGNRVITARIADANGNTLIDVVSGANQAAGATQEYTMLQGVPRETSFLRGEVIMSLPIDCYLGPGYTLSFLDTADISSSDDMVVSFQAMKFQV